MRILRSGIHTGEERQVLGNDRSGMIVFSGCHLSCSFCYTPETSVLKQGKDFSAEEFTLLLADLLAKGARNINLISPSHVWGAIEPILTRFKSGCGKDIVLVLKFSGYESASLIDRFARVADVLVPDFKVFDSDLARSVHLPANYGSIAANAVARMIQTHGTSRWEGSKMRHGMIVRHLLMPGCDLDSQSVVATLSSIGYRGYLNLMTHFVPPTGGLVTADRARVSELVRSGTAGGMRLLVDAKEVAGDLHSQNAGRVTA